MKTSGCPVAQLHEGRASDLSAAGRENASGGNVCLEENRDSEQAAHYLRMVEQSSCLLS